jgi:hypothetical protein
MVVLPDLMYYLGRYSSKNNRAIASSVTNGPAVLIRATGRLKAVQQTRQTGG